MISGTNYDIVRNPKKPAGNGCTFCKQCPSVTKCSERTKLKMKSQEYILTTKEPSVQETLHARINAMPLAPTLKGSLLGNVSTKLSRANFIIHSASLVSGGTPAIFGMCFCVTFLSEYAKPLNEKIWVSGAAMNTMITHNLVKKKYVFDETIHHKDGWTSRFNPKLNSQVKKYESSDEDDMPLDQLKV